MLPNPETEIEVSVAKLAELRGRDRIRIIDCREEDEWSLCRIEGAELVPLSRFAELTQSWAPAEGEVQIVYCHHGMRSLQATQFLRAKGFSNTFSLAGGIDAWSTEIDPSVVRY